MIFKTVDINEVNSTRLPVMYTCHGLGSCIAVFITDSHRSLAGAAHIPLPYCSSTDQYRGAASLINSLLESFRNFGSDLRGLRAKIAGGANFFNSTMRIGEQNIDAVVQVLVRERVFITAQDVGGTIWRLARFNSKTSELTISTSDRQTYII